MSNEPYNNDGAIEPRFFPQSQSMPAKKKETTSDVDLDPYWSNVPPPYTPSSSEPSAPPLDLMNDNSRYPAYPNYGSTQPVPVQPRSNQNWPWIAPPRNNQPNDDIIPYEIASAPPKPKSILGKLGIIFLLIFIFIATISLTSKSEPVVGHCFHGQLWKGLPSQLSFDEKGLHIRITGGGSSGVGRIILKDDASKAGTIEFESHIYPPRLLTDPRLRYSYSHVMDGGSSLEISLPVLSSLYNVGRCVRLDLILYLPSTPIRYLTFNTQNMDYQSDTAVHARQILLTSTNSNIRFGSPWVGDLLKIVTSNGDIVLDQSIVSHGDVYLETSNADISLKRDLTVDGKVSVYTSNGDIKVESTLSSASFVAATVNGKVLMNTMNVTRMAVKSSNGAVKLEHGKIQDVIAVETSNSKLDLAMDECSSCRVAAVSSNGNIVLDMPGNFEGTFDLSSNAYNKIYCSDSKNWSRFNTIKPNQATGSRTSPDHESGSAQGDIRIKTSNGDVELYFRS